MPRSAPRSWIAIHCARLRRSVGVVDRGQTQGGPQVHAAVDTPEELLVLHARPVNELERDQITGEEATCEASAHGIQLEVVERPEGERGFVLVGIARIVQRQSKKKANQRLRCIYRAANLPRASFSFLICRSCLLLSLATRPRCPGCPPLRGGRGRLYRSSGRGPLVYGAFCRRRSPTTPTRGSGGRRT